MNFFKRLMKRTIGNTTLKRFDDKNVRIEWIEGNRLKFTFLKSCYVPEGDTVTINIAFNEFKINPGVIYGDFNHENG